MSRRAESSGIRLTQFDASTIKGMLRRGDRQHDIAAWFGVNGGRIAEISTGRNYWWVDAAASTHLPPPGPYPCGRESLAALEALHQARQALAAAESMVRGQLVGLVSGQRAHY